MTERSRDVTDADAERNGVRPRSEARGEQAVTVVGIQRAEANSADCGEAGRPAQRPWPAV